MKSCRIIMYRTKKRVRQDFVDDVIYKGNDRPLNLTLLENRLH